jgi:cytosine/adenosine deaminase-related metal-dependent hydrolase
MFSAMRALLAGTRYEVNLKAIEQRTTVDPLPLLATDVLAFATQGGARAAWLGDRIGSITPGMKADLIMIRRDTWSMVPMNNPAGAIVESGHPGLVDTVFVNGRLVKRDGRLLDHSLSAVRRLAEEARDRIMRSAGIGNPGKWLPELYEEPANGEAKT